ncbi:hypothetical protein [Spirosoma aerophilum]
MEHCSNKSIVKRMTFWALVLTALSVDKQQGPPLLVAPVHWPGLMRG